MSDATADTTSGAMLALSGELALQGAIPPGRRGANALPSGTPIQRVRHSSRVRCIILFRDELGDLAGHSGEGLSPRDTGTVRSESFLAAETALLAASTWIVPFGIGTTRRWCVADRRLLLLATLRQVTLAVPRQIEWRLLAAAHVPSEHSRSLLERPVLRGVLRIERLDLLPEGSRRTPVIVVGDRLTERALLCRLSIPRGGLHRVGRDPRTAGRGLVEKRRKARLQPRPNDIRLSDVNDEGASTEECQRAKYKASEPLPYHARPTTTAVAAPGRAIAA